LRAKDFGELTVWAAVGLAVLLLLAATYVRSTPASKVHMLVEDRLLRHALLIIEDGGEMLAMSLVCWFVARLTGATPR
jgi:hypothetical protein